MDKPIVFSQEQGRSFDFLSALNDVLTGLGVLTADILFGTGAAFPTVVGGLVATPGSGLTINLAAGSIYQLAALDTTAYGTLGSNSANVIQQGKAAAQAVVLTTAALTSGKSQWVLIETTFGQVDAVRTGDPTGGILPYVNAANPTQPLQGPAGAGTAQATVRQGVASIRVLYGGPATTGTETPPNPDAGYVPLYLVDLAFGQATITGPQILAARPSAGTNVPTNYPYAPFLSRLVGSVAGAGAVPTAVAGAGAGASPPAPVVVAGSTDARGTITFGTGTGPAAGVQVAVTFANPRIFAPIVILTPLNAATAALAPQLNGGATTTGFSIATTIPAASQGNGVYGVTYMVLGA